MKSTVNISLFIFILLLVCAFNVEGQKSKWRGKVEYKDEVKVVENPREPVFGEVVYDLAKICVLGNEKNEHDIFALIWEVQVDAQGNVYISDFKERRIKKFSSEGEYLHDIGLIGQGPGEFQGARNLFVDDQSGDIYLADFMKIHRYKLDGTYQDTVATSRIFRNFFVDAEKSFWARAFYQDERRQGEAFEKK